MQWIDDIGGQTFVKQESKEIVAVMPGGLESYFYLGQIMCCRLDSGKKRFKTLGIILDGKDIGKHCSI